MAGKDGIKRRYGRNALSEWFEADIGQENNCRAAIVCDGRPFCGKGELRPGLTAGADRAAFDRVLEEFCRRVPGTVTVSYEQTDRQYAESETQIRLLAWGLILFIGLIGILNIINTVYTNIHTRITEIGIQRAMGMSAEACTGYFCGKGSIMASVRR